MKIHGDQGLQHVLCTAFSSRLVDDQCYICNSRGAKVVECTHYGCDRRMHIMCSRANGFVSYDLSAGGEDEVLRRILCPEHATSRETPSQIKDMLVDVANRELVEKAGDIKGLNAKIFRTRAEAVKTEGSFSTFTDVIIKRIGAMHARMKGADNLPDPDRPCIEKPKKKLAYKWENDIKKALLSLTKAFK